MGEKRGLDPKLQELADYMTLRDLGAGIEDEALQSVVINLAELLMGKQRQLIALQAQLAAADVMRMLWEFHDHLDLPRSHELTSVPGGTVEGRIEIMGQEWEELKYALATGDLVKIADALADLAYGVFGTAVTYGIDLNAVIAEVHRSNMTKDRPRDRNGKAVKGPNYEPPRIAEILERAARTAGTRASEREAGDGEGATDAT